MKIARKNFRFKHIYLFVFFCFVLSACLEDQFVDKYERPEWLAGKVYSQVKEQAELSLFTLCLELTGYVTIIDVSSS